MTVWWLATSKNSGDCSYTKLKQRKVVGQGWGQTGDLSSFIKMINSKGELEFISTINKIVEFKLDKNEADRNPGQRLLNLVKMQAGDIVVICEGKDIKALAEIGRFPQYSFDCKYLYPHQISPVDKWHDWEEVKNVDPNLYNNPPNTSAQGPKGIEECNEAKQTFIDLWRKLESK